MADVEVSSPVVSSVISEVPDALSQRFQSDLDRNSRLSLEARLNIALATNDAQRKVVYENQLRRLTDERSFLRVPNEIDIDYRKKLRAEYAGLLRTACPPNLPLRFHGTSIMATQHIIEAGKISSAVDHEGVQKSFDVSGQISVTTPESCQVSIRDYLNVNAHSLPVGSLFVLLPKDSVDKSAAEDGMAMANSSLVDENGHQSPLFYRVLASPEGLPKIREWLTKKSLNPNLATEYFAFLEDLRKVGTTSDTATTEKE